MSASGRRSAPLGHAGGERSRRRPAGPARRGPRRKHTGIVDALVEIADLARSQQVVGVHRLGTEGRLGVAAADRGCVVDTSRSSFWATLTAARRLVEGQGLEVPAHILDAVGELRPLLADEIREAGLGAGFGAVDARRKLIQPRFQAGEGRCSLRQGLSSCSSGARPATAFSPRRSCIDLSCSRVRVSLVCRWSTTLRP